jgi:hypothetical protein
VAGAQAQGNNAHVQDSQDTKQCNLPGMGEPNQEEQAEGQPMCPAAVTAKPSTSHKGQHRHGCTANPAAIHVEQRLPAAGSDFGPPLALLLPGLVIEHAASTAGLKQAPPATPVQAAPVAKPGSAPLQLNISFAAESALQLSTVAVASPEQQQEALRAFVYDRLTSIDVDGTIPAHWPEPPAFELRLTQGGLCEGGLAERLFRRMGSTPAAATLLRTLICPLTKVCCCALSVCLCLH